MKFFLISDNVDTRAGMRLAGIEGEVVHSKHEIDALLDKIIDEKDVGIILITELLAAKIPERMTDLKLSKEPPLIVEIPDRHGTHRMKDSITRYVNESLGIKFQK